jgi:hypothetical protein
MQDLKELDKLLDTIMSLASYDMYNKYNKHWKLFANIESKIHFYLCHHEPITNINLLDETKQLKELIEVKEVDCIEFYNMLIKVNAMLKTLE